MQPAPLKVETGTQDTKPNNLKLKKMKTIQIISSNSVKGGGNGPIFKP
jgi:hypothetical protein